MLSWLLLITLSFEITGRSICLSTLGCHAPSSPPRIHSFSSSGTLMLSNMIDCLHNAFSSSLIIFWHSLTSSVTLSKLVDITDKWFNLDAIGSLSRPTWTKLWKSACTTSRSRKAPSHVDTGKGLLGNFGGFVTGVMAFVSSTALRFWRFSWFWLQWKSVAWWNRKVWLWTLLTMRNAHEPVARAKFQPYSTL